MGKVIIEDGFENMPVKIVVDNKNQRVYAETFLLRGCEECDEPHVVQFKAIAKTHPEDKFNEQLGIKLAKTRLSYKIHKFLQRENKEYLRLLELEVARVKKDIEKEEKKISNVADSIKNTLNKIHENYSKKESEKE